jgi:hypothetical protein
MRFEFHSNGTRVATAQWEGPGQVSLELPDEGARREFARFFAEEQFYLGSGFGTEDVLQVRRRDWTPWEFERACRELARMARLRVDRVPNGPVEQRPDRTPAP